MDIAMTHLILSIITLGLCALGVPLVLVPGMNRQSILPYCIFGPAGGPPQLPRAFALLSSGAVALIHLAVKFINSDRLGPETQTAFLLTYGDPLMAFWLLWRPPVSFRRACRSQDPDAHQALAAQTQRALADARLWIS